jgi:FlaA1/EpsC-like NDP-sugar epimerase
MRKKNILLEYRRMPIVLAHICLISSAYFFAFYIRFDFSLPSKYFPFFSETISYLVLIKVLTFHYFGLFAGLWRYVSMEDLWQIIKANIISTVVFMLLAGFVLRLHSFPRSIFILDFILCVGLISGVRFANRAFREKFRPMPLGRKKIKTIIVGAGTSGIMILKELRNNPQFDYDVVGFVDDDPSKKGFSIYGLKVLGDRKKIPKIIDKYGVEEIIIAIPAAKGTVIRDIISYCQEPTVKIKIAPDLSKILSGDLIIKLKDVSPEDLLNRESVKIDMHEIESYIKNKKVLITGGCGSIGSEISRQVAGFSPPQLILFDHNENDLYFLCRELKRDFPGLSLEIIMGDIEDSGLLRAAFTKLKPQIVFHSAAFKHVPLMEENPSAAVKNNVTATRKITYASDQFGVERFIYISTDKAVNPTSVMGATKRIGEMIVQSRAETSRTKFISVRFGNVLGSKGSVVPLFKKQIEEGGPVTVTDPEVKRYFMSLKEAVQLVLQAGAIGEGGEIFILDMGEQIKIYDLARNMIALSGLKPGKDIDIEFIGLRPGEKLYEEILHDSEQDSSTKHDKIYIAQPGKFVQEELWGKIKELEKLAGEEAKEEIINKIKEIVTSYTNTKNNNVSAQKEK